MTIQDLQQRIYTLQLDNQRLYEELAQAEISQSLAVEETTQVEADGFQVPDPSHPEVENPLKDSEEDDADVEVISEELGVVCDSENGLMFQGINDSDVTCRAESGMPTDIVPGDVVRMIRWANGQRQFTRLETDRTLTSRQPLRKNRRRLGKQQGVRVRQAWAPNAPVFRKVLVVGGSCPTRYKKALLGVAASVEWHNGFDKRLALNSMLLQADCVITVETQMSHWAMYRIKALAKAGRFVWKHVKVKSQSTVVNAVLSAACQFGAEMGACEG